MNDKQFLCQAVRSLCKDSSEIPFSDITDSSPLLNHIFATRRASSCDITFRHVHADVRAKIVVHSGQRPYGHAYVAIRSLLWA